MINRQVKSEILQLIQEFPAVAVLGPRQVGKTTLARDIADEFPNGALYLDLESPSDLEKIKEPELYFEIHKGRLIILDEIQRVPGIFQILRGVIDQRRREGLKSGQFLILGSASLDLLRQSSESLAGRIAYKQLTGITVPELSLNLQDQNRLWVRGGFPDSYLAASDEASFRWRLNFITTYLERDVPLLGYQIPAASLRPLWTMLAYSQSSQLNLSQIAMNLGLSVTTIKRYVELLDDLLLVRQLRPWTGNIGKRLVKTPKVYVRDSGITHALLNLISIDDILSHPVAGASWEGFIIENILSYLPDGASAWFYRTSAGAEIDLVIEQGTTKRMAIEIKRSLTPTLSKGFHIGCEDIKATHRFIVYPGMERYPASKEVTALPLSQIIKEMK